MIHEINRLNVEDLREVIRPRHKADLLPAECLYRIKLSRSSSGNVSREERYGGQIEIESAEGRGTTAKISLPIRTAAA